MVTKIKTKENPALDANGRFTVTCGEFEKVSDAVVSGVAGYPAEVQSISGNVVTVQVRQVPALTPAGTIGAIAAHSHIENVAASYSQSASTEAANLHTPAFTGTTIPAQAMSAPGVMTITGVFRIAYEGI